MSPGLTRCLAAIQIAIAPWNSESGSAHPGNDKPIIVKCEADYSDSRGDSSARHETGLYFRFSNGAFASWSDFAGRWNALECDRGTWELTDDKFSASIKSNRNPPDTVSSTFFRKTGRYEFTLSVPSWGNYAPFVQNWSGSCIPSRDPQLMLHRKF